MQDVVRLIFPVGLGFIMLGLGLSLTPADFRRVLTEPRAVVTALVCQALIMPFACFGVAKGFGLSAELGVGLMLLAASPGGTVANLYSHMSRGDVALNITLTAVNSIVCLFTLPVIVNLSLVHFMGEGRAVPLQFGEIAKVFAFVIVPAVLGMAIRARWTDATIRAQKAVKILSAVFLAVMILLVIGKSRAALGAHGLVVLGAVVTFSFLSLGAGYFAGRLMRVRESQAIAMGMEIGIHNAALAITIAISPTLLASPVMAVPPTVYGVAMMFTAAIFGWAVNRIGGRGRGGPAVHSQTG